MLLVLSTIERCVNRVLLYVDMEPGTRQKERPRNTARQLNITAHSWTLDLPLPAADRQQRTMEVLVLVRVQWCSGIEYRTRNREVAGSIHTGPLQATLSKLLTYCVLRPTQPPTLSGTGNE